MGWWADGIKNEENAKMAEEIQIGDKVRVIRNGEVGVVTKKVVYNRKNQPYFSPHGYTTIQVKFDERIGHKKIRHYAGTSLEIL